VNGMPDQLRDALLLKGGGVVSLVGAGGKTSLMFRLAQELSAAGETVLTTTTTRIFMPEEGQSRCVILADTAEKILERAAPELNEHRHLTAAAGLSVDPGKLAGLTVDDLMDAVSHPKAAETIAETLGWEAASVKPGEPAPDFTLPWLRGADSERGPAFTLSSRFGRRPVALIFGSYT